MDSTGQLINNIKIFCKMMDTKQTLLEDVQISFLADEFYKSSTALKNLYDHYIDCNCFFEKQPKSFWKSLLDKAQVTDEDETNYDINFVKGFIYLNNQREAEAFDYFTTAIELNTFSDICYSLRATLGIDTNPSALNDAKEAVVLNPTARNFFRLAATYEKNHDVAIYYLRKSISLNKNFICAYKKMAARFKALRDYRSAISCYEECIEFNQGCDNSLYFGLWECFDKLEDYQNSLDFIELRIERFPLYKRYYLALGITNEKLDKLNEAIDSYVLFLSYDRGEEILATKLDKVVHSINNLLINKALISYSQNHFGDSNQEIKDYVMNFDISYDSLEIVFQSALKYTNPQIDFSEANPHYIKLSTLISSYNEKKSNNEPVTEDEENIAKLKIYQSYNEIGFGIYEGLTIQEVMDVDSQYILWCVINLHHFLVNPDFFLEESLKTENTYVEALEVNIIKAKLLGSLGKKKKYRDYTSEHPIYGIWRG